MKIVTTIALLTLVYVSLFGQNFIGTSYQYDFFPQTEVSDTENQEIEMSEQSIGVAYPIIRNFGKRIYIHKIEHINLKLDYNLNDYMMDDLQSYRYSLLILNSISTKWNLLGSIVPSLSSDFEDEISWSDFNCEFQVSVNRVFSKSFTLGGGLSYFHDNINQIPYPYIWIDWKPTDRICLLANLPSMIDFNYKLNDHIDFSSIYSYIYERYHGKKDYYHDSEGELLHDPILRRSGMLLSQKLNINFTSMIHLSLEGGYGFVRSISFYDDDMEMSKLEIEPNHFISAAITIGM